MRARFSAARSAAQPFRPPGVFSGTLGRALGLKPAPTGLLDSGPLRLALAITFGAGIGVCGALAVSGDAMARPARFLMVGLILASVVAITGGARRLLLGLICLDIPFQWDQNFAYRDDVAQLHAIAGWNVSLTTLALAGLYLLWLPEKIAARRSDPRQRAFTAPLVFVGLTTASALVAADHVVAAFELSLLYQMLLLFIYLVATVRSAGDVRFILTMLLVGLCLESLLALTMYATGAEFRAAGIVSHSRTGVQAVDRVGGTIGSPNEAGSYFCVMTSLALAIVLTLPRSRLRALAVVGSILGTVALALTFSRGGWIGFVVAVLVLVVGLQTRPQRRLSSGSIVAAAVVAVCILLPLMGVIGSRVTGDDEGAAAGRVPLMQIAVHMIEDHPVMGVGANNFAIALPHYLGPQFSSDWLSLVHNKYLLIWSESGIGALLAFLVLLAGAIRRGWRGRVAQDPLVCAANLGLAAGLAGLAVHMNFDIFKGRPMTQALWVAIALLAAPALRSNTDADADADADGEHGEDEARESVISPLRL